VIEGTGAFNIAYGRWLFGILLPRNLSKPREKRVIVEQLIKDVIVSIKGQKKKDIIVTFLCFDLKK
jgi:hypothetical protein